MNKVKKIVFALIISILILLIPITFKYKLLLSIIIITFVIFFKYIYPELLVKNRNSERWCKKLSDEELEIVEDAKELIKSVDSNIVISSFNVYKVRFVLYAWFEYDEDTQELNIFIPFKLFSIWNGKDGCFLAVLHEILHSQNLKNNFTIFEDEFLEGLNQFFTIWLIDNYSEKYKVPKDKRIRLIKGYLNIYLAYHKEMNMVKNIFEKFNIDFKHAFLKYIDFQPEFFEVFIPSEYLKKNDH